MKKRKIRDEYSLPSIPLQKAYKAISKEGRTRQWVARTILDSIQRAVEQNPKLRAQSVYAQIPEGEALIILEERLRIADPACAEHADYKAELAYYRGRKRAAREKARRQTDEAWRIEQNAKRAAYRREKRRTDPEFRAKLNAYAKTYMEEQMQDPLFRIEKRRKRRERYQRDRQKPGHAERVRANTRRWRKKHYQRMEEDPLYAIMHRTRRAEENQRYRAKVKLRKEGIVLD